MEIIKSTDFPITSHSVATIGFFDGVHRGHGFLINQLNHEAEQRQTTSMAVTFDCHPRQVLDVNYHPQMLSTLEEKLANLEAVGVDKCALLTFTHEMAALSAYEFMQRYLVEGLGVEALLIGYDHHFGNNRSEGFLQYKIHGKALGIEVIRANVFETTDVVVSSSAVRRFLTAGNVEMAKVCLGRSYTITGKVVEGRKLGHKIGFPTANVQPNDCYKMLPADGVYAVKVEVCGMYYRGMLNIGCRPTMNNGIDRTIEVNLLDFEGNLYGQTITLFFVHRLRNEQKFNNIDDLMRQLMADEVAVRNMIDKLY